VQFKEALFNEQTGDIEIAQNPGAGFFLNYFNRIGHYAFDTYLIVLFALEDICEANHVINETRLVQELHTMMIALYNDNMLKDLPSCLKELIETALRRFDAIKLGVINHYKTQSGSSISFVSCPFDRLPKIQELKLKINELQQFNEHELQVIAVRVEEAIKNSLVQHLVARL